MKICRTAIPTAVLLLLYLTAGSVSAASFTPGQHTTMIRIDDIQDYESIPQFIGPEYRVLQYQIDQHVPTLVALITSRFGTNAHLMQLIRTGFDQSIFLLGNHGWHHDLYNNKSRSDQIQELGYAENRLQTIFGVHVLTFIPPYGGYDDNTIAAMKANEMTMISTTSEYSQVMFLQQDGILFLPQTVTTAEVDSGTDSWIPRSLQSITDQITASWEAFGLALVVIHPRQFVDVNNTWVDAKWNIYTQMIDWIRANQGSLLLPTPPSPPPQAANISPLLTSVVLFSGLTSSLIIGLNISSKRSRWRKRPLNENPMFEAESRSTPKTAAVQPQRGGWALRIFGNNSRPKRCSTCTRMLRPKDRYCDSCGRAVPLTI